MIKRAALAYISDAVRRSGGVLLVMDGKLMIYGPKRRVSPILQRLINRYERELRYFVLSMSL